MALSDELFAEENFLKNVLENRCKKKVVLIFVPQTYV